jgi:hypothetical protein
VEVTEKHLFVRRAIIEHASYRWAMIRTVEGHTCAHGARSVKLILIRAFDSYLEARILLVLTTDLFFNRSSSQAIAQREENVKVICQ